MSQENPSSSSTRKLKFTPKVPKRKPPTKPSRPRSDGTDEDAESELLLKHFQEKLQGRRQTTEKKPPVRVAFGPGAMTPTSSGTEIVARDGNKPEIRRSILDRERQFASSASADRSHKIGSLDQTMEDASGESNSEDEVYQEPWDYEGNYPTILPLRRPYSGDPEILDEAEFGEAARNAEYNEKRINAAAELGLLEESERQKLLFFQLPRLLPSMKGSVSSNTKGKEPIGQMVGAAQKCCGWEDIPAGHMGKLLVYKSGAVKLKLGETLYDVSPGSAGEACEDVMAMNVKKKECCRLGPIEKHAVVSLDVDSILDGLANE